MASDFELRSFAAPALAAPPRDGGEGAAAGAEDLVDLARRITGRLTGSASSREEILGETFLVCDALRRERPDAFADAARAGELESFCLEHVRTALRGTEAGGDSGTRPRGGWLHTYIAADGRDVAEPEAYSGTDAHALHTSQLALRKAFARARDEGNDTLLRNLEWYRQRLDHRSYEAIASSEQRVVGTVRTGVARARKFVLRIVHELEHEQPAPLTADAPPELEPLRQLWQDQDLETLERELDRTEPEYASDPHWLNLRALLAAERGDRDSARRLYERGLVQADAAEIRARILNNLANLHDDEAQPEAARIAWMRAHQLAPHAAAPLLNLLAAASAQRDYASAQHFVAVLGELMSSGRIRTQERTYAQRRLRENPRLAWLRGTELWRLGPARWLRSGLHRRTADGSGRSSRSPAGKTAAVVGVLLSFATWMAVGLPRFAQAEPGADVAKAVRVARPGGPLGAVPWNVVTSSAKRGGDSMGSPADRGGSQGN